ncbi:MAG TPA: tyrosine--tRNA ligase [Acidimicrobiales bacterium]|nr:tyrosine--tRNA ligase [Acidimicrobiales bacterium]
MAGLTDELRWRGLVHQATDEALFERLDADRLTFYVGFDPTADSLGIGNLLQLCTVRRLQDAGHRPLLVAGGGTGTIGDPGGKSDERPLLSTEQLAANLAGIRRQLERFADFEAGALLLDNGEWLAPLRLLDFLRDVGKHATVNAMIAKDSVRARLEERERGISYAEFSYMLLQAFDFLHLFDVHGCTLQIGGSDQWGNIVTGVDLIRRVRGSQAFGVTTPLVLRADGTKFGKSEAGNLWLAAARTSPYQLFQAFLRVEDAVVGRYLRFFTWLDRDAVEALDEATGTRPAERRAQRALAREVVGLVHGAGEAAAAERAAAALFSEDLAGLDEPTLLEVMAEAPSSSVPRSSLDGPGLALVEALASSGLSPSRSAARTAVEQGGAYVNNRRQQDLDARLTRADLLHDRYVVLRRGKRDHHLLRVEG